jgi:hypothetical protein
MIKSNGHVVPLAHIQSPTKSPNQSIWYIAEIDEHLVQSYPRRPVVSEYGDPASPITR